VRCALDLARETGARVHFVHISTPEAARAIADSDADASAETCPHYLSLDESDLERLGPLAKCAPPLRSRSIVAELLETVFEGGVDFIASDHSPCPPDMKQGDIWTAWGGIAGVQTTLPVLLLLGLPLPLVVRLLSANPARRLGLYPRKGTLQPGSDADLVLLDPAPAWRLEPEMLRTRWPISPYLGRELRGRVAATLVRGAVVYRDGKLLGQPGYGQPV
jgi:allantoinase